MKPLTSNKHPQLRNQSGMSARKLIIWVLTVCVPPLTVNWAKAAFHLWAVTEVYSSADGSVQFVRLTNNSIATTEYFMTGHSISATGPGGTHTFVFPADLPHTTTANKNFLIGTSNLSSIPGGITPDYVLTNTTPFLFPGGGTISVGIASSSETPASYTNLPTDGSSSLRGLGSSLVRTINSPQNFAGQSNSIVPVQILSTQRSGTNFVMSFRTATGVNGSAGPNYSVEFKHDLSDSSWSNLTTIPGNGSSQSVSNDLSSDDHRVFRLNAH
jgi:hypothetical protein